MNVLVVFFIATLLALGFTHDESFINAVKLEYRGPCLNVFLCSAYYVRIMVIVNMCISPCLIRYRYLHFDILLLAF